MLKPDIFASIMDFFASNVPILTEDQPASDTGDTKQLLDEVFVISRIIKVKLRVISPS